MRVRLAGAVAMALALASCGGGSPRGGATTPPPGGVVSPSASPTAAVERYEDARFGFAFDIPEGWTLAEDPSAGVAVQLYPVAGATDAFAENLNVVVEELQTDLTASGYMDLAWAQLEPQLEDLELIGRDELAVGGLPAASIEYRARFPRSLAPLHLLQVAVLDGRTAFVLTYTGADEFRRYRPGAEAVIASFSRA